MDVFLLDFNKFGHGEKENLPDDSFFVSGWKKVLKGFVVCVDGAESGSQFNGMAVGVCQNDQKEVLPDVFCDAVQNFEYPEDILLT